MSNWTSLRDYSRSLAVLIGTWDYAFLNPVPAAEYSLRRMEALLQGPWCGWPQDRLIVHPNVASPGDLPDQLIAAFDTVTDVAVFYFVGHGQISPDDQLCLGLARSRPESSRRAVTSLRFGDVRQALLDSKAAVKIVILDCCFAGLATRPSLAGDVLDLTAGTGAYTMAATSAYTTAWYQDEPGLAQPQTYFTKYLADLIENGIPGLPSRLRVDPLFRALRANLAADGRPVPDSRAVDNAREFEFAYNAAPADSHRDPELELGLLAQRFDDEVARRTEAEIRLQALQAEVLERRLELERLQARTRHMEQLAASQQHQLLEAVDEAARSLDDKTVVLSAASDEARAPGKHARRSAEARDSDRTAETLSGYPYPADSATVTNDPLLTLPVTFFDFRGTSRTMRVGRLYDKVGTPVISIFQGSTLTASFRLPTDEVPRLVDELARGPRNSAQNRGASERRGAGSTSAMSAPLPRLGEIFFDVRGSSRSMRLSWYSDTGIAVFSIWQGGTCTGTFRMSAGDVPRAMDAVTAAGRDEAP